MKEIFGKRVYESLREIVNPKHTAAVIVDMQNDFCSPGGHFNKHGRDISMFMEIQSSLVKFMEEARKAGVRMVFTQHTVLPEGWSDSPSWLRFIKAYRGVPHTVDGTWGQGFCAGLEPQTGELVVKKHRSSAFVETDLDLILRSNGIESIIVTGCATHSCVMATALHGAFHDYYVVVVSDCVASTDRGLHEAALKIMGTNIDIANLQEIVNEWSSS